MNFYIIYATLTLDENIALHEKQAKLEKRNCKTWKAGEGRKTTKNKFELVQKKKVLELQLTYKKDGG